MASKYPTPQCRRESGFCSQLQGADDPERGPPGIQELRLFLPSSFAGFLRSEEGSRESHGFFEGTAPKSHSPSAGVPNLQPVRKAADLHSHVEDRQRNTRKSVFIPEACLYKRGTRYTNFKPQERKLFFSFSPPPHSLVQPGGSGGGGKGGSCDFCRQSFGSFALFCPGKGVVGFFFPARLFGLRLKSSFKSKQVRSSSFFPTLPGTNHGALVVLFPK